MSRMTTGELVMWPLIVLVIVYLLVVIASCMALLAFVGGIVYNVPRRWRTTRHEKAHPSNLVDPEA